MKNSKLIFATIFSIIIALVWYFKLDHMIAYYEQLGLFLLDGEYWRSFVDLPTGIGQYTALFIAQFFYYPSLGAVIMGLIYGGSYYMLTTAARSKASLALALVPLLYMLLLYNTVNFYAVIGVFLNIIAFRLWALIPRKIGLSLIPVFAAALFAVSGVIFYISALLMIVDYIAHRPKRIFQWIVIAIIGIAIYFIPILAAGIYNIPIEVAGTLNVNNIGEIKDFDTTFIIIWIAYATGATFLPAEFLTKKWWLYPAVCTCIVGGFGYQFFSGFNHNLKYMMTLENAANHEHWEAILKIADESGNKKSRTLAYMTNTALFRTGQLTDRMFDYPQKLGEFGLHFEFSQTAVIGFGDYVFANTGMVCEAHRWAYEAMLSKGENSTIYRKLIKYNLAMGRKEVADRHKMLLDKSLFYRSADIDGSGIWKMSQCADSIFNNDSDFAGNLRNVVAADPTNYGALEYLAANYLLANQLHHFVNLMPLLLKRYNGKLPRIYDEALIVYSTMSGPERLALPDDYAPSETVRANFLNYSKSYNQSRANPSVLENSFGKTYWYYLSFHSPYGLTIR